MTDLDRCINYTGVFIIKSPLKVVNFNILLPSKQYHIGFWKLPQISLMKIFINIYCDILKKKGKLNWNNYFNVIFLTALTETEKCPFLHGRSQICQI